MLTVDEIFTKYSTLNFQETEGGIGKTEAIYLLEFLRRETQIKTILEIGFNGGLSSTIFLDARPDITVISVDIGFHDYILKAKTWIDKEFPDRHMLLVGDSAKVLPQLMKQFPLYKPDMIFVDGDHGGEGPKLDLINAMAIAKPSTFIVIDDVVPWMKDILGPLNEFVKNHKLHIIDHQSSDIWGWVISKKIC